MLQFTARAGALQPTLEDSRVKSRPWPETEEKPKQGRILRHWQHVVKQLSIPQNRVENSSLESYSQETHLKLEAHISLSPTGVRLLVPGRKHCLLMLAFPPGRGLKTI